MSKFDLEVIRKLYYVWDRSGIPKSLLDVANELNIDYYELIDWIKVENKKAGAPVLDMHIITAQKAERHHNNSQFLLDFKCVHQVSKRMLALIFGYSSAPVCLASTRKAPMWKKGLQVYNQDPVTVYEWQPSIVAAQIKTSLFTLNKAIYGATCVGGIAPTRISPAPEKRKIELYEIIKYYAERCAKLHDCTLDDVINMAVTTQLLDLNL